MIRSFTSTERAMSLLLRVITSHFSGVVTIIYTAEECYKDVSDAIRKLYKENLMISSERKVSSKQVK